EKRGRRSIEALLNDYYYETAAANTGISKPARGALVYFPYMPHTANSGAGQRCLSMLRALRRLDYRVEMLISTAFNGESASVASVGALERDLGIRLHIHDATPEDLAFQAMADKLPWERLIPPGLYKQFLRIYWEMEPELVFVNYADWAGLSYDEDFDDSLRVIDTHHLVTVNQAMLERLASYFPERPVDSVSCDPEVTREDFFADPRTAAEEEFQIYDRFDLTIASSAAEAEAIRAGTRNTRV